MSAPVAATTLERKRVPLGRQGAFVDRFLVLDCGEGTVRCAYYRPRHPGERDLPPEIPEETWTLGIELGWFSEKGKASAWRRGAGKGGSLGAALRRALAGVALDCDDARTIEAYVRSTAWGAGLP